MATAAAIPHDLVQAFLGAGAAAVISRSPNCNFDVSEAEVAAYFRELYKALFEERCSTIDAVNAAGEPSACNLYFAWQSFDRLSWFHCRLPVNMCERHF